jgi:phosphoribosylaminoimidazole-succinocarboxamide synthase
VEKKALRYEGKAKKLYETDEEGTLWVEYLDQATALNGARKEEIPGKGALNNQISSIIYEKLNEAGISTHFIRQVSDTEQLNRDITMIPMEVVLRNVVAGSFAKRFGLEEGAELKEPIIEFYYKSDALDDPFINEDHIAYLGLVNTFELMSIKNETRKINTLLKGLWQQIGLTLVDFKLEFGKNNLGLVTLADEITPDTCRLWDKDGKHMDKDVFRRDLGDIIPVYETILKDLKEKVVPKRFVVEETPQSSSAHPSAPDFPGLSNIFTGLQDELSAIVNSAFAGLSANALSATSATDTPTSTSGEDDGLGQSVKVTNTKPHPSSAATASSSTSKTTTTANAASDVKTEDETLGQSVKVTTSKPKTTSSAATKSAATKATTAAKSAAPRKPRVNVKTKTTE